MTAITMIALGELKLADDNLRTRPGELDELAESIKSLGILEPLLVRTTDKVVVAGARRLMAAKKAGLKEVPAILREFTEQERLEVMIVENLQREGLTPLEEADGFKRLAALGISQKNIGKRVGCSQSHVAKRLSLLELPAAVQKQVGAGTVRLEAAQQLAKIKDAPEAVARIAAAATAQMRPDDEGDRVRASAEIGRKVEQELRLQEQQKKVDVEVAKLTKAGETVIPLTSDSYGGAVKTATKGTKIVLAQGYNDSDLVMVPSAHRKLDCHAIGVHPVTLDVVEVCTDPSKHKTLGQKKLAARKKDEAAKERDEAKRVEAKQRRQAFYEQLVRGKVDAKLLIEVLSYYVLDQQAMGYEPAEKGLVLLGVEQDGTMVQAQFAALAEKNQTERIRVLLAALVARAGSSFHGASDEWIRFLVTLGYEPSEDEQAKLDEADAEQASRDEADAAAVEVLDEPEVTHHPGMVIDGTVVIVPPENEADADADAAQEALRDAVEDGGDDPTPA